MATIIRQSYIDKIERYLGKETIIVLVGQRRVGKSYTLKRIVNIRLDTMAQGWHAFPCRASQWANHRQASGLAAVSLSWMVCPHS